MSEQLTLKDIALRFINRIANPSFENKAIGAFVFSGLAFIWVNQPSEFNGHIQFDIGYLKAGLEADNDPNWYLLLLGVALLCYGGFAHYKSKISPSITRHSKIGELLLIIEKKKSSLKNAQIQQFFWDLFKIKAPVPVIEYLLAADDPIGHIHDFRYGGHFVDFNGKKFKSKDVRINHEQKIKFFSRIYSVVSFLALVCIIGPLAPFIENPIKMQLFAIGFPIAIPLGFIAALALNPIRSHSAATRLLLAPVGESTEKLKDTQTIVNLLNNIHTPTFDSYVHFGKLDLLDGNILHFWEGFNACVSSSSFHIYSEELGKIVNDLHASWKLSLSFDPYFTDTSNVSLLKFDSRYDIYRDEQAKFAHDEFGRAINTADEKFRELLSLVRKEYPSIDIDKTNKIAADHFRSYQIAKI